MKNYLDLLNNKNAKTKEVKIGDGVVTEVGQICKKILNDGHVCVVYFEDCKLLAKKIVRTMVDLNYRVQEICYCANTIADLDASQDILSAAEDIRLFVAVGSGSLSDIVRYACFRRKTPHVFIATAPSTYCMFLPHVDYFLDGQCKRFEASPADAVIFDCEFMNGASDKLLAGGYGEIFSQKFEQFEKNYESRATYLNLKNKISLESYKEQAMQNFFDNFIGSKTQVLSTSETLATIGIVEQLNPSKIASEYIVAKLMEKKANDSVPFGINLFIASITLMHYYEKVLLNKNYSLALPTDIVKKSYKYAKSFSLDGNLTISNYKWNVEFEKQLFIYEEYRKEFGDILRMQNKMIIKNIKQFRRIFDDVGYWLSDYLSADEIIACVEFGGLIADKDTVLAQAEILGLAV